MRADPEDTESGIVWVKYTRGIPVHKLWKLKDEQYRMNSYNEMGTVVCDWLIDWSDLSIWSIDLINQLIW